MQTSSANQMHMQMEHRLPGSRTHVHHRAIPIFDPTLARILRCHEGGGGHYLGDLGLRVFLAAFVLVR